MVREESDSELNFMFPEIFAISLKLVYERVLIFVIEW